MNESLRKYIISGAAEIKSAEMIGFPCVHLIYRISESGLLQRVPTYVSPRRNLMGLFDDGNIKNCDTDKLARDILNEMTRRSYSGIVLDVHPAKIDPAQIEKLCILLSQKKAQVYLPIELAQLSSEAKIIVPSSISGGSLREMLLSVSDKYTPARICLEIIRCRNDFTMPSYKPEGTNLNKEAFENIVKTHDPISFFSSHLGCKYFTYRQDESTHFVLFDDPDTAVYKLKLAESLGLFAVFIMYSEWGESSYSIITAK